VIQVLWRGSEAVACPLFSLEFGSLINKKIFFGPHE
jgi:hypothetical protein